MLYVGGWVIGLSSFVCLVIDNRLKYIQIKHPYSTYTWA